LHISASLDGSRLPSDVILRLAEIKDLKIISQDAAEFDQSDGKLQFELETVKVRSFSGMSVINPPCISFY
jgi:hypothetical protein